MTRCLGLVLFVAACTEGYGAVTITAASPGPVGIGLTESYSVEQQVCDPPPDGGCDLGGEPLSLTVTAPGKLVAITNVAQGSGSFALTGLAPGTTQVDVTADGGVTATTTIQVTTVASLQLFATRPVDPDDDVTLANVPSPVQAFTDSQVVIGQAAVDVNDGPVAGSATLELDPGPTGTMLDPNCGCFVTGDDPGSAQISTSLANLTLNVVTADAIADFTIAGVAGSSFEIPVGPLTTDIFLVPTDANGSPIVGLGPTPTFAISDPAILYVDGAASAGVVQSFTVSGGNPGTTSFDITWGNVHKTFDVTVVALTQMATRP
jgi:hypothetical protein